MPECSEAQVLLSDRHAHVVRERRHRGCHAIDPVTVGIRLQQDHDLGRMDMPANVFQASSELRSVDLEGMQTEMAALSYFDCKAVQAGVRIGRRDVTAHGLAARVEAFRLHLSGHEVQDVDLGQDPGGLRAFRPRSAHSPASASAWRHPGSCPAGTRPWHSGSGRQWSDRLWLCASSM